MNNFKYKLYQFMYGRYGTYGVDAFNKFLMFFVFIGLFLNLLFFHNNIFSILLWVLLLFYSFRIYSKNITKRKRENDAFLRITRPIHKRISIFKKRRQDPHNKYYLCPSCLQIVRVPKGRGKITITCPSCQNRFDKKS